jgi:hypothetical protein
MKQKSTNYNTTYDVIKQHMKHTRMMDYRLELNMPHDTQNQILVTMVTLTADLIISQESMFIIALRAAATVGPREEGELLEVDLKVEQIKC